MSWDECCGSAIEQIRTCDHHVAVEKNLTVQTWHRKFRIQHESFANPVIIRAGSWPSLPPFLARNPDATKAILSWTKENLAGLKVETVHS